MVSPPTLYICFQLFQRLQTSANMFTFQRHSAISESTYLVLLKLREVGDTPILHLELEQVSLFEGVAQQPRL